MTRSWTGALLGALGVALVLTVAGCGEAPEAESAAAAEAAVPTLGVELDAAAQVKLGIRVAGLESATYAAGVEGPARVVDARTIVTTLAELGSAEAAVRASRSALSRAAELFKIDAAVSAETRESAERQAATDQARYEVARAEAQLAFGAGAPWLDAARRDALVAGLSGGTVRVVSATFTAGLGAAGASGLTVRRLGEQDGPTWSATQTWPGPADPAVPGQTLLALVEAGAPLAAGERLVARVPAGVPQTGVVVPASAIVLAGGQAWCYVRSDDDDFERIAVDLSRPVAAGYFETEGFEAGQAVVVAGAGLMLAYETGGVGEED